MSNEALKPCPSVDSNGTPFDESKVERAAMLLVDLHPLLGYEGARRVVLCAGNTRSTDTPVCVSRDLAAMPCETTGPEDAESGCCGPCRARAEASQAPETIEEIQRLREHISEHITFAETRIQDGIDLGATVWRLALEDIAQESRAALSSQENKDDR